MLQERESSDVAQREDIEAHASTTTKTTKDTHTKTEQPETRIIARRVKTAHLVTMTRPFAVSRGPLFTGLKLEAVDEFWCTGERAMTSLRVAVRESPAVVGPKLHVQSPEYYSFTLIMNDTALTQTIHMSHTMDKHAPA